MNEASRVRPSTPDVPSAINALGVEKFSRGVLERVDTIFGQDANPPPLNDLFGQKNIAYEVSYNPRHLKEDGQSVPVRSEVTITLGQTKRDVYEGISQDVSVMTISDDKSPYVYRFEVDKAWVESRLHTDVSINPELYKDPHDHVPWTPRIRIPAIKRELNSSDIETINSVVSLMEEQMKKGNVSFTFEYRKPFEFMF